jgi:hypothetical protein
VLQAGQRLANGAAAHIEAAGEIDLARQALSRLKGAGLDAARQTLRDALILGSHLYEPVRACTTLNRFKSGAQVPWGGGTGGVAGGARSGVS